MLISPNDLRPVAEFGIAAIFNSLLAGIAVSLLAWVVVRLFGRHGSGTRFVVWFSALITIVIMPLASSIHVGNGLAVQAVSSAITLPAALAPYLFGTWLVVATLGLLRVGFSLWRLRQLRSGCTTVDPKQLGARLLSRLAAIQEHRSVKLCTSSAVRVPAAMGYIRPIVVFPNWALTDIAPDELDAILVHELAHLRRWDDWTNLAQKIVKAVFFFHPAVWIIDSRLALEREIACDAAVLDANFSPRGYAQSLLSLAEQSFLRRGVQLAQAAVGHVNQLRFRITEILRKNRVAGVRVWKPAIVVMAVAGAVGVLSISRGPHLLAFSSDSDNVAAASSFTGATVNAYSSGNYLRPVNASFTEATPQRERMFHSVRTTRVRVSHPKAPRPRTVIAQRDFQPRSLFDDRIVPPPMMVLSNFMARNAELQRAVLFVVQGEQFGVNGPVFWRLTVVQLTTAQQRALIGGVPRQI
jgi:beta-lactamase regulating signal transducer with metallopeptidase domain